MSGPWKAAWPRGQAAVQGRKFKAQLESGVAAWPAFIRLPATVSPQSVVSGVTLPSAWLHYAKRFPTKLPQFALTVKMHNMIKLTTVLLNSDPQKKKLLHPKSIPTSQCYNCTLIFNNFEMFRMKIFELKPQTGGVNA